MTITRILFGPGGGKCFSFLGSMDAAIDKGSLDLNKVECFGGVSGGSLVAFCYCVGLTSKEVVALVKTLDFDNMLDPDPSTFIEEFGLCRGNRILYALETLLHSRLGVTDVTFAEMTKTTSKTLLVQVTNLSRREVFVCSPSTTPDLSVLTALRMSIAVPFVFSPITYKGEFYVDGSILQDTIDVDIKDIECTLSFELQMCSDNITPEVQEYPTIVDYSLAVFNTFLTLYQSTIKRQPADSCRVRVVYEPKMAFLFPDAETIAALIDIGYQQFMDNCCGCDKLNALTAPS